MPDVHPGIQLNSTIGVSLRVFRTTFRVTGGKTAFQSCYKYSQHLPQESHKSANKLFCFHGVGRVFPGKLMISTCS